MLVHINRNPVNGPYGGGNLFVKAFHEFADSSREEVELDKDITGRSNPDVIMLAGLENDQRGGISAEQAIMYQMTFKPSCKLVLRVNENDARKATRGVDEMWVKASKYMDSTVFVSHWLQSYFNERGWACKDQHVIYNGVQRSVFKPGEKLNNGKVNLLMSHWSDNYLKGQDYAEWLDAFVGKHSDEFTFTYVGRTQANFKHSTHIRPLSGIALGQELGKYDVCINASRFDPGPNSVIEPITCGLPTYVHKDGGGAVEFAGHDHAFSTFEELECLLLKKQFIQNTMSFLPWKDCIQAYIDVMQHVHGKSIA